jgi:hypothetical protein
MVRRLIKDPTDKFVRQILLVGPPARFIVGVAVADAMPK